MCAIQLPKDPTHGNGYLSRFSHRNLGAAAGCISGASAEQLQAHRPELANKAGLGASPPLGATAGAVIRDLTADIAGCTLDAALGRAVDKEFLGNRSCLNCGYFFTTHYAKTISSPLTLLLPFRLRLSITSSLHSTY